MKVTLRAIFTLLLAASVHGSGHREVLEVGQYLQLFVTTGWWILWTAFIANCTGPAAEVAMPTGSPWGALSVRSSVMKEGSLYPHWYRGAAPRAPSLGLRESVDGIHWVKRN